LQLFEAQKVKGKWRKGQIFIEISEKITTFLYYKIDEQGWQKANF
jgi:hypothetical protein